MWNDGWRGSRRWVALAGVVLCVAPAHGLAKGEGSPQAVGAATCAGAQRPVADLSPGAARSALRCLVAAERRSAGLGELRPSPPLRSVALALARDQLRRGWRGHVSPEGADLTDRLRRYAGRHVAQRWDVAEATAWTQGTATPARLMDALLASRPHRRIVLGRSFRLGDVGLAGRAGEAVAVVEVARVR